MSNEKKTRPPTLDELARRPIEEQKARKLAFIPRNPIPQEALERTRELEEEKRTRAEAERKAREAETLAKKRAREEIERARTLQQAEEAKHIAKLRAEEEAERARESRATIGAEGLRPELDTKDEVNEDDEHYDIKTPPESFVMPESAPVAPKRTKKPAKTSEELSDKDLDPALSAIPQKPTLFGTWKRKTLGAIAGAAALFGIIMHFEGQEDTSAPGPERIAAQPHRLNERTPRPRAEGLSSAQPHHVNERTPKAHRESEEARTIEYTVQPGDTLWGIADRLLEERGVNDESGEATLNVVREMREANGIQGVAANRMRVGQELDLTSAYKVLGQYEIEDLRAWGNEPTSAKSSAVGSEEGESSSQVQGASSKRGASMESGNYISPESTKTHDTVPAELLYKALSAGETIWSRAGDILKALGKKPNIQNRAVLAAIVLTDSKKTEAQAMRIRAGKDPKWDASKDYLDFDRAAKAAVNLKNGMSPSEVAREYKVEDVYTKLRDR